MSFALESFVFTFPFREKGTNMVTVLLVLLRRNQEILSP
jgi:hypothetical protein